MSYTVDCKVCSQPFKKFSIKSNEDKCRECRSEEKLDARVAKINDYLVRINEKIQSLESSQDMILETVLAEIKLTIYEGLEVEIDKILVDKMTRFSDSLAKVNSRIIDLSKRMDKNTGVDIWEIEDGEINE